jgi:hypothetical protein
LIEADAYIIMLYCLLLTPYISNSNTTTNKYSIKVSPLTITNVIDNDVEMMDCLFFEINNTSKYSSDPTIEMMAC